MSKKNKYNDWTKEELINRIEAIEKRKKYGLIWEEEKTKEKFEADAEGKLPVLVEDRKREITTDADKLVNILIEGDNYHALSVLNYTHPKSIDVIYIDPPYNTGAKDWKYNNDYVDTEDPYRHSKWLSFVHNRLSIAKNLLKDDGIICVTIDDNEMPRLWCLLDEVFGENNHLGTVAIRNNPKGRKTERKVSLIHEYAIFYGKSVKAKVKKLEIAPEDKTHNYKQDTDGSWYLPVNLRKQGVDSLAVSAKGKTSDRYFPIYYDPDSKQISSKIKLKIKILPIDVNVQKRIWRRGKDAIDEMYQRGDLWCQETRNGLQVYFKFRGGLDGEPPESIWYDSKYSASEYGTQILDNILGKREAFQYPKSPYAVMECIKVATTNKNAIILDYFAGSGTTGHAVMILNKEDGGQRQFILCTNNENNICTDVCYPRVQKVIEGYKNSKAEKINGLGGNLKYFKTAFVGSEPTHRNKKLLTDKSVEMLCIKENTFEEVLNKPVPAGFKQGKAFHIFKNKEKYLAILFDEMQIDAFKKEISKLKMPVSVYAFSLEGDDFREEFEDLKNKITLCSIPEAILKVYRRIFR